MSKPSERRGRAAPQGKGKGKGSDAGQGLDVATRPWFLLGFLHLAAAAVLGAAHATGLRAYPAELHAVVALGGAFLVAGGLAYGFAPPFLKRAIVAPALAMVPLAAILAGDAAALLAPVLGTSPVGTPDGGALRAAMPGTGGAMLLVPLHLGASAAFGPAWRGGIALFAKDQPYRQGDLMAAAFFALANVGAAVAGAALLAPPRGLPSAGLALGVLLAVLPFFAGVLLFLLPRNAKTPMPGLTLVSAALAFHALGAAALAYGFARPVGARFALPAAGLLLGGLLFGWATLRLRYPEKPGPQLARARPFLNAALATGLLAPVALVLSTAGGLPNELLPLALYAYLALAALLAVACALLGAPILLNAVPRQGAWGKWAAALVILGLFLVAPAFQYPRSAFPGAAVIAAGALLVLWGLAPMRTPRRACD